MIERKPHAPEYFEVLKLPGDARQLARALAERNLGDGFPVVRPTPDLVDEMLEASPYPADHEIGWMPPVMGLVSPRFVAINAILAGCMPEHMPVLLAAAEAMLDPAFNLFGIQPTTNPVAPLVLVHGPIRHRLKMNAGSGAFGPGNYANAVIGRAIRFMLLNLGGAIPGQTDKSTQGGAIKYSFCVAENAEDSPWAPFHTRRGLQADDDAVTVFGTQAQHNVVDFTAETGEEVIQSMAGAICAFGTNNMTHGGEIALALGPEHAAMIADAGFTPETAAQYLFEHGRYDLRPYPQRLKDTLKHRRPIWVDWSRLPVTDRWEQIQIFVVGGPGIHSQFLPSFGATEAVTRKVVSRSV